MNEITNATSTRRKAICKCCGDQASGFNYDQLTCQSCKVFFHRYGFYQHKFKCKNENQCHIDVVTRVKCKACRLAKCFSIGMVRNVEKPTKSSTTSNLQLVPSTKVYQESQFLEELFTHIPRFLVSPFTGISSLSDPGSINYDLNGFESTKIAEILHALDVVADESKLPVVLRSDNYYAGFQTAEIYVRMIIKFCKRMSNFSQLSNADQMAILKPFCFDILMIRFAFTVQFTDGGLWPSILDERANATRTTPFNLEAIARITARHHDKFMENYEFTKILQAEMEGDPVIRDLLTALVMFKNHVNISCSEFIKYNFTFYSRLLQKYCAKKYASWEKADEKITTLMRLIMNFERIKNNEKLIFYEMDMKQLPAVYYEIYDL